MSGSPPAAAGTGSPQQGREQGPGRTAGSQPEGEGLGRSAASQQRGEEVPGRTAGSQQGEGPGRTAASQSEGEENPGRSAASQQGEEVPGRTGASKSEGEGLGRTGASQPEGEENPGSTAASRPAAPMPEGEKSGEEGSTPSLPSSQSPSTTTAATTSDSGPFPCRWGSCATVASSRVDLWVHAETCHFLTCLWRHCRPSVLHTEHFFVNHVHKHTADYCSWCRRLCHPDVPLEQHCLHVHGWRLGDDIYREYKRTLLLAAAAAASSGPTVSAPPPPRRTPFKPCLWRDCDLRFDTSRLLWFHVLGDHIHERQVCLWRKDDEGGEGGRCSFECKHKFNMKRHVFRHVLGRTSEGPFQCMLCGRESASEADEDEHILLMHDHDVKDYEYDLEVDKSRCLPPRSVADRQSDSRSMQLRLAAAGGAGAAGYGAAGYGATGGAHGYGVAGSYGASGSGYTASGSRYGGAGGAGGSGYTAGGAGGAKSSSHGFARSSGYVARGSR